MKEKKTELKKQADQTKTNVLNDVMEILQKTQVNPQKVGTGSAQARKELKEKKTELKKQADQTKTNVLNDVMEILQKTQVNPQKVGTGSICFVGTDGQFYTLKLTKNKSCPNGYEVK